MIPNLPMETTLTTLEYRDLLASGVDPWDFDYPSYYEGDAKKEFEKKVNDHFLFRQIGQETVGRFLHVFRRTVREIMPVMVQRYKSIELMDDPAIKPLDNYSMIEEYTETRNDTSSASSSATTSSSGTGGNTRTKKDDVTRAENDTPQGELSWTINNNGTLDISHASAIGQEKVDGQETESSHASESGESTGTTASSSNGGTTHKLTRSGNIGVTTYAQMLEGYRATFIDVDLEIIEALDTCFLGVY